MCHSGLSSSALLCWSERTSRWCILVRFPQNAFLSAISQRLTAFTLRRLDALLTASSGSSPLELYSAPPEDFRFLELDTVDRPYRSGALDLKWRPPPAKNNTVLQAAKGRRASVCCFPASSELRNSALQAALCEFAWIPPETTRNAALKFHCKFGAACFGRKLLARTRQKSKKFSRWSLCTHPVPVTAVLWPNSWPKFSISLLKFFQVQMLWLPVFEPWKW